MYLKYSWKISAPESDVTINPGDSKQWYYQSFTIILGVTGIESKFSGNHVNISDIHAEKTFE